MDITVFGCVRVCVCVCIWEFWTLSPSPGVKREEQQFPLEGKSHQRHQKIQKGDPKIQFQTKWALSRTTNRPWPPPSLTQIHRNVSELWIKCYQNITFWQTLSLSWAAVLIWMQNYHQTVVGIKKIWMTLRCHIVSRRLSSTGNLISV